MSLLRVGSTLGHTVFFSMLSYLCEAEFLAVGVIKSKYYLTINVEQEMRPVVSILIPRFEMLHRAQVTRIPLANNCGYLRVK